jgi:1,4-alpha-glucan branching enzyme
MATNGSTRKKVNFTLQAPEAVNVAVAGDFTSWEINPKPMKKNKSGQWKATVSLEPGRYEYKFIVDGQWLDDPESQERAPNPYGGSNCVRVVA